MKNRKALEGNNQFQSGWVSAVKYFVTDPGVTILTAAVMHSQALNESKLGLLHRKMVLLFVHIVTVWLVSIFVALDLFHICFFNGKNCFEIYYNGCCPSITRRVFEWFMYTHSNCDNIS